MMMRIMDSEGCDNVNIYSDIKIKNNNNNNNNNN